MYTTIKNVICNELGASSCLILIKKVRQKVIEFNSNNISLLLWKKLKSKFQANAK